MMCYNARRRSRSESAISLNPGKIAGGCGVLSGTDRGLRIQAKLNMEGVKSMPKAFRTDQSKYEQAIREAKIAYFKDLLAPYIKDGFLDTKTLKAKNPKLHEEFRLAFKGIRAGSAALGIPASQTALKKTVGPARKQAKTLAIAYIEEVGEEAAAGKLGTSVDYVQGLLAELKAQPKPRTYKRKAGRKPRKK